MTPAPASARALVDALATLGTELRAARLPLEDPGVEALRGSRDRLLAQLDDYVVPRLQQLDAPLLAVVGGSTGAGKSTLVNAVVGRRVTRPGVLRPTTRSPVLVVNPGDLAWFDSTRVLPELARTSGARGSTTEGTSGLRSLELVTEPAVPAGLAVLDAPDVDSVEAGNRALAGQLLAAADLWLFVTSAARYADQVPWDLLAAAAARSTAVAVVLDRVPPGAADEVAAHLRSMLDERGLAAAPLFVVEEGPVDAEGLLDPAATAEIRGWLHALAADAEARGRVVRQTLAGAVTALAEEAGVLAQAQQAQVDQAALLRDAATAAYGETARSVSAATADGSLLRGEVLARWQEFVGTGELMRSLEGKVSRFRDRVTGWFRGTPVQVDQVSAAVESGLEALLVEHAETAAERASAAWTATPAGRALLEGPGREAGLGRASRDLRGRAERAVRDWQLGLLELVRAEGAGKRSAARFLAFGVNGLSVSLMVVVFAHTGGMTGAELGIAGGSAVVGQTLLEAVFGDDAVRRLAEHARTDLDRRVALLLAEESARYTAVLDTLGLDDEAPARLRAAAATVARLRVADLDTPPAGTPR